jgi:V/A-type H+-transporting ATPase subunit D
MINPTRMNLITTKRRIVMAKKGYTLLKRKREVLVLEFLQLLKQSKQDRDSLNRIMERAYRSVTIASVYVGDFELQSTAMYVPEVEEIGISLKGVMGVRIPKVTRDAEIVKTDYNLMSTSIAVDDINESFTKALDSIIDVAQRELGLKKLVIEIDKVKRRVNALEYKRIPELAGQSKYIYMRLDEIERDSFAALKHVKKRINKSNKNTGG